MGSLAGSTGFSPFNSYISLADGDIICTAWSQLSQLGVADSPDNTTIENCAYVGWSTTSAPFDIFNDRIQAKDFQGTVPIGAIVTKIQMQTRSHGTFSIGNRYGYAYDFDLYKLNYTYGNNQLENLQLVEASTSGNPLRIDTFGSDAWGVVIGYGSIKGATVGINYRTRVRELDSGTSNGTQSIVIDYLFMDITYKQTGVMLAM